MLTVISTSKSAVVVLIQSVPPYVPTARLHDSAFQQAAAGAHLPNDNHNGSIIKRFSKDDGGIAFTVKLPDKGNIAANEVDVDLRNIYTYVSPAELERYENLDWELDDERRRNRKKVGRPRKTSPSALAMVQKPKRPLGRPRKYPVKTQDHGPADFVGVHIPSPVKPRPETQDPSPVTSVTAHRRESLTSAVESVETSASDGTPLNIDQLTPSNARKVTAVRPPPASPPIHSRRTTYSMVEASLGRYEISDEEEVIPESGSEDELSLNPSTREPRFASRTEISNSTPGLDEQHESLFLSRPESSDNQASTSPHSKTMQLQAVHNESSTSDGVADTDGPDDILEQLQAGKTRRIESNSSSTMTSNTSKPKLIHEYFKPKSSAKNAVAYPSLFPNHSPIPSPSISQDLSGNAPKPKNPSAVRPHINESFDAQKIRKSLSPVPPSHAQHPKLPSVDHIAARKSTQAAKGTRPQSFRPAHKSMTPHFPSSNKHLSKSNSPRLRGGTTKSPFSTKSPTKAPRATGAPPPLPPKAPILQDRHQIQALLASPPHDHTDSDVVILGSPLTPSDASSEERNHLPGTDPLPPQSPRPDIMLGSPLTSSSEDPRIQPSSSSSPPSQHVPNANTNHRTKRRRGSSDGSGSGSGKNKGRRRNRSVMR
ncbi:MAG: hypothetical protein Q9173_002388 [Seirophora scorigena]